MKPVVLILALLAVTAASRADTPKNPLSVATMVEPDKKLLLPMREKALSSHSAYDMDKTDCSTCHKNKDPKDPGPLLKADINAGCLECHDDIKKVMTGKFKHQPAELRCTLCHTPHDSAKPKLLLNDVDALCLNCHDPIKNAASNSKCKHDALTTDKKCLNCHNPHASEVEHLLSKQPFDLCLNCHGQDGLTNHTGLRLTNMKTLLSQNPEQHGPIATKDCTSCHNPHGSENFRLLAKEYPQTFYSPYDAKLYALCFDCHEESLVATATTTSLTQFRNGDKNLHFVHVNKDERGRTCRACHEVHASKQKHQIRDSVPYGVKGWPLRINYTPTPFGGTCTETCHSTRSYTNVVVKILPPAK